MAQIDQSDIDNITQLVEAYDGSGGFKFSWRRICAYIKDVQNSSHNTARDAIAAWENHCKQHLKGNGPACDITNNEMCKHWFIMGYNA